MPTPNPSRSKPKSFFDQDKYTAELSSGQLVYGIAILLLFGVACFALGVVVGKFEPAPRGSVPTMAAAPGNRPAGSISAAALPGANGSAASERPKTSASPKSAASQRPAGDPWKTSQSPDAQRSPRVDTAKAPEASAADTSHPGSSPPPGPRHVEKLPVAPQSGGTETKTAPPMPPVTLDAVEPEETSMDTPPVEPAPVAAPAADTSPRSARADGQRFTLQIAAVSSRVNAEKAKTAFASKSPHAAELTESANGKLVIIRVGDFPDKESAEKARQELMAAGLATADSFVTKRDR